MPIRSCLWIGEDPLRIVYRFTSISKRLSTRVTPATCLAFVSIAAFSSVLLTGPRNVTVPSEVMIFMFWAFVDNESICQPQPGGHWLKSARSVLVFGLIRRTFELPHRGHDCCGPYCQRQSAVEISSLTATSGLAPTSSGTNNLQKEYRM